MAQADKKKPAVKTRNRRGQVIAAGSGVSPNYDNLYVPKSQRPKGSMDPRDVDPLAPQSSKGALEKMYGTKRQRSGVQKKNIRKSDLR